MVCSSSGSERAPANRVPVTTQGRNIRLYAVYLVERIRAYRDTKCDWVRGKEARLEDMSVNKGLLRETEVVQKQLAALLNCDVSPAVPRRRVVLMQAGHGRWHGQSDHSSCLSQPGTRPLSHLSDAQPGPYTDFTCVAVGFLFVRTNMSKVTFSKCPKQTPREHSPSTAPSPNRLMM